MMSTTKSIQEAEEPEWDHVTHPHLNLIGHDIAARYVLYLRELLAFPTYFKKDVTANHKAALLGA